MWALVIEIQNQCQYSCCYETSFDEYEPEDGGDIPFERSPSSSSQSPVPDLCAWTKGAGKAGFGTGKGNGTRVMVLGSVSYHTALSLDEALIFYRYVIQNDQTPSLRVR